jgi:hypothetical protein
MTHRCGWITILLQQFFWSLVCINCCGATLAINGMGLAILHYRHIPLCWFIYGVTEGDATRRELDICSWPLLLLTAFWLLFERWTIADQLKMGYDSMASWLRSVQEECQQQLWFCDTQKITQLFLDPHIVDIDTGADTTISLDKIDPGWFKGGE